jgi:hypothetical protein
MDNNNNSGESPSYITIIQDNNSPTTTTQPKWLLIELQGELCLTPGIPPTSSITEGGGEESTINNDNNNNNKPTLNNKLLGTISLGGQNNNNDGDKSVNTNNNNATLIIGSHKLEGKRIPVPKPFAILKKIKVMNPQIEEGEESAGSLSVVVPTTQYKLVGTIDQKIIFKTRPKPLFNNYDG